MQFIICIQSPKELDLVLLLLLHMMLPSNIIHVLVSLSSIDRYFHSLSPCGSCGGGMYLIKFAFIHPSQSEGRERGKKRGLPLKPFFLWLDEGGGEMKKVDIGNWS